MFRPGASSPLASSSMPRERCLPIWRPSEGCRVVGDHVGLAQVEGRGGEQGARAFGLELDADLDLLAAAGIEGLVVRVDAAVGQEGRGVAHVGRPAVAEQVAKACPAAERTVRLPGEGLAQVVAGALAYLILAAADGEDPFVAELDLVLGVDADLARRLRQVGHRDGGRCHGLAVDGCEHVEVRCRAAETPLLAVLVGVVETEQHRVLDGAVLQLALHVGVERCQVHGVVPASGNAGERALVIAERAGPDGSPVQVDPAVAEVLAEGPGVVQGRFEAVADGGLFLLEAGRSCSRPPSRGRERSPG